MKTQVLENPVKNQENTWILTVIACLQTVLYITANLMAVRVIRIGEVSLFDAGTLLFPVTYMLGDALTEIWGFRTAKKVILLTFVCNLIFVVFTAIGGVLPYPAYQEETVRAYNTIFRYVPRIMGASMAAFLVGELANAWSLIWIREKTGEKHLWVRTVGSSVLGHALDSAVFVILAFGGISSVGELCSMTAVQYLLKLLLEIVGGTPMVYALTGWLKRRTRG